ncbi:Uncharacterised protein [Serratia rubidaea]|nr:Uncharacterised protein [Serratia rubidaea]
MGKTPNTSAIITIIIINALLILLSAIIFPILFHTKTLFIQWGFYFYLDFFRINP